MKYDICYSITAHESIECVYNLYENIIKFNPGLNCLVIFHVNGLLASLIDTIPQRDNLTFNPEITEKERFTQSLMWAHISNYNHMKRYDFDLFCTLASNCMFVKNTNIQLLRETLPGMTEKVNELQQDPSINFDKIEKEWFWDKYVGSQLDILFSEKRIGVNARCHEGAYFRRDVIDSICSFSEAYIRQLELLDGMDWIEIVFPSLEKYFTGRVEPRYCIHFPFNREITEKELLDMAHGTDRINMVKRVERSMNSRVRRFICTSL